MGSDSRTAFWKPGLKNGARRREFYEDRGARISILAGRRPPRPDTLKQTDQRPIPTKPLADGAGHTFFKRLDDPFVLRRMARPCADVGEAELLEQLSNIAPVKLDPEPLGDDALESIRRQRTTPSFSRSGPASTIFANSAICSAERRGLGPCVQLSIRPSGPKPLKRWTQSRNVWRSMPPIFAAAAIHSIPHRSQRQKPPALVDVFDRGQRPKLLDRIVLS